MTSKNCCTGFAEETFAALLWWICHLPDLHSDYCITSQRLLSICKLKCQLIFLIQHPDGVQHLCNCKNNQHHFGFFFFLHTLVSFFHSMQNRGLHCNDCCLFVVSPGSLPDTIFLSSRSQWPRGLRHRSSAARLLRWWVRIPPGAWMFVCCGCCVLLGRGLCDGLIIRSEESYRLWHVVCDQVTSYVKRLKPIRGL